MEEEPFSPALKEDAWSKVGTSPVDSSNVIFYVLKKTTNYK